MSDPIGPQGTRTTKAAPTSKPRTTKAARPVKPTPPLEPTVTASEVQAKIDKFIKFHEYHAAIRRAAEHVKAEGIEDISDRLVPLKFREMFDPEDLDCDLEEVKTNLLVEVTDAIRASSPDGDWGKFCTFMDDRDGTTYLVMPNGMVTDADRCNFRLVRMRNDPLRWSGVDWELIAFEAGRPIEVPLTCLKFDAGDYDHVLVVGADGTATLAHRPR